MKNISVKEICYMALFVALLTVCSWLSFTVGTLSYTFQLLAVLVCAGMLGWWRSLIVVAVYILLGTFGVPVFASFTAGIMSSTRGYVIGFLFTVLIVGLFYKIKLENKILNFIVHGLAMVLGVLVCYAFGTVWFVWFMNDTKPYTIMEAIGACILPYAWFDAIKIGVSLVLVETLSRFVKIDI